MKWDLRCWKICACIFIWCPIRYPTTSPLSKRCPYVFITEVVDKHKAIINRIVSVMIAGTVDVLEVDDVQLGRLIRMSSWDCECEWPTKYFLSLSYCNPSNFCSKLSPVIILSSDSLRCFIPYLGFAIFVLRFETLDQCCFHFRVQHHFSGNLFVGSSPKYCRSLWK